MGLRRPGVLVEVSSLSVVPPLPPSPATFFLVGYAPWGPVNKPVYVGDIKTAKVAFGEPRSPQDGMWIPRILDHFLRTSGGNGRAWVVRGFEVAPGQTIDDYRAVATLNSGTSPALIVKAAWPGELGLSLKVDVIQDSYGRKYVYLWGRYGVEVLEWSSDQTTMAQKVADWNALADALGSDFRLALPATFVAAGPDTTTTATSLLRPSSGAISLGRPSGVSNLDGASNTFPLSALYGTDENGNPRGLDVLADEVYGPGLVAIPGYAPTATLVNLLDTHARTYGRLALVHLLPSGSGPMTAAQAKSLADGLPRSSYVAYYFPRVYDLDGVLSPLEGYVAGLAAARTGAIDAEGGVKASITGELPISDVERVAGREPVKDAEAELLYSSQVNYVRFVRGRGFRLESQLLSAPEGAISRIHHRNIANYFKYLLTDTLQGFRDRTVDGSGALFRDIHSALSMALDPYGPGKPAPNGNTLWNPAIIVSDASIQTEADLNQGLVHVYVEAAFSPKAERIQLYFNVIPVRL